MLSPMACTRFTLDRWRSVVTAIGAAFDVRATFEDLQSAYSERHRAYHDVAHIDDCLARFDEVADECEHPLQVELALWFHDVIYASRRHDNEEASARAARSALAATSLTAESHDRIEALIMATVHNAPPRSPDAATLVDIDLSILGRDAARFDEYEDQVRREYRWVPGPIFRSKRAELLELFLARPRIYATETFYQRYEAMARKNLARSIARLRR